MRIEKEAEVTIKVRIAYVWPDDFEDDSHNPTMTEEEFRAWDSYVSWAPEIVVETYSNVPDLMQAAEVTVRDRGVVQE